MAAEGQATRTVSSHRLFSFSALVSIRQRNIPVILYNDVITTGCQGPRPWDQGPQHLEIDKVGMIETAKSWNERDSEQNSSHRLLRAKSCFNKKMIISRYRLPMAIPNRFLIRFELKTRHFQPQNA